MESTATQPTIRYFCHKCNLTISIAAADFLCPHCNQGFIEKLSDSSASSSYTDRSSENNDDYGDLGPLTVLDTFLNSLGQRYNVNNRVQVMLRREEGNGQNATENGPTSSNQRDASNSEGRTAGRRRARVDSYNLNPERILHEFFNLRNNDNGQVFLVSNPGDYAWGREGLDTIVTQLLNQMDSSGPPPLASDKIQELPFVKITDEQVSENVQCSVCWDSFRTSDNVRQLPCEHIYHDPCIVPWLQLHGTCPICRKLLSEESESRLGGFAQGGGLEALLSNVQRRLSYTRRPNSSNRCYRCNDYGHFARNCPVRGNRHGSRNRGQSSTNYQQRNRGGARGAWGSNSYESGGWSNATSRNTSVWGSSGGDGGWGASSAPAAQQTAADNAWHDSWGPSAADGGATTTTTTTATANSNDAWGADGWTSSNRAWPTAGETTGYTFTIDLSENEDDDDDDDDGTWFEFDDEDYPTELFSSADDEDWEPFEGYPSFANHGGSSGSTTQNAATSSGRNYASGRNLRKCYNCGVPGHMARECPSKYAQSRSAGDNSRRRTRCATCFRYGHETSNCWNNQQSGWDATTDAAAAGATTTANSRSNVQTKSSASSVRSRPPTPFRSSRANTDYANGSGSRAAGKNGGYRGRQYNNSNNSSNQGGAENYATGSSTTPSTSRQSFRRNVTCWNCNESGHLSRDCPERRCCNVCRSVGHRSGECREVVEF